MEQYQYVEGFQRFHTGLRLRCAACLSLQFFFLSIYVEGQFYPWFNFYFPLFLGMVIYDNEFETKGNKN